MIRRLLRAFARPWPGPAPATGAQVIDTPGLPDGYTPPSTSLGPAALVVLDTGMVVTVGIRYGVLTPTTRITVLTPDDARRKIAVAFGLRADMRADDANELAEIAVETLTGSPDA